VCGVHPCFLNLNLNLNRNVEFQIANPERNKITGKRLKKRKFAGEAQNGRSFHCFAAGRFRRRSLTQPCGSISGGVGALYHDGPENVETPPCPGVRRVCAGQHGIGAVEPPRMGFHSVSRCFGNPPPWIPVPATQYLTNPATISINATQSSDSAFFRLSHP